MLKKKDWVKKLKDSKDLPKKHKATICCPLTSGIFAGIAARAAEQEREQEV